MLAAADVGGSLAAALPMLGELARSAPTVWPFAETECFRLPGSRRSWCRPLHDDGPVLVVKGSEPAAPDMTAGLDELARPCYSWHDIDEHLLHDEGKVPLGVTRSEALGEARQAALAHVRHWRRYSEVARLPLPLLVARHDDEVTSGLVAALDETLSPPAAHSVRDLLGDGLHVLVYAYPSPPVRARDLDTVLSGRGFHERQLALLECCDAEQVVARWVRLFTRLLHCGLLPGSAAAVRTGMCCQPQNACVDGGFVDVESLVPAEHLRRRRALDVAVHLSLEALVDTVTTLLLGEVETAAVRTGGDPQDRQDIREHVLGLVRGHLADDCGNGPPLDPRIQRALAPAPDHAALVGRLAARRVPPAIRSRAAAVQTAEASLRQLRRARTAGWR